MTMRPHIIRQGEHLLLLAGRLGFDADEVWQHEDNRELRERRESGQVLAPGDVLFVPEVEEVPCGIDAETTNRYQVRMPRALVRVHLRDGEQPLSNEPYRLLGLRVLREGRSDGDGLVEEEVPAHVGELRLMLPERGTEDLVLRVGHYDPPHTREGIDQRLRSAGASVDLEGLEYDLPVGRPRDEELEAHAEALRRFQEHSSIEPTGEIDEDTMRALEEVDRA